MRSAIVGACVLASVFGLAGVASADVTNNPSTTCTATAVCLPVNVPLLPIDVGGVLRTGPVLPVVVSVVPAVPVVPVVPPVVVAPV